MNRLLSRQPSLGNRTRRELEERVAALPPLASRQRRPAGLSRSRLEAAACSHECARPSASTDARRAARGLGPFAARADSVSPTSSGWTNCESQPSVVERVVKWYTMTPPTTQQDFLRSAKARLALDWDTFAVRAGISPRALKSYRLPSSSAGHRTMPDLARAAVEDLLRTRRSAHRAEPAGVPVGGDGQAQAHLARARRSSRHQAAHLQELFARRHGARASQDACTGEVSHRATAAGKARQKDPITDLT